jgi:NAD(P)-dependent dehydrogenase (short-subunit alcohol dehydrogenase family)
MAAEREREGEPPGQAPFSRAEWETCLKVMRAVSEDPSAIPDVEVLKGLATRLYRDARKERRRAVREEKALADRVTTEATQRCRQEALTPTGAPTLPEQAAPLSPEQAPAARAFPGPVAEPKPARGAAVARECEDALTLRRAVNCYVCKAPYTVLDAFYHLLCPACAAVNHAWRVRQTDLTGRRALITGGRIKIGHQLALKFLRDGAEVLVTTRFPHDALRRFSAEPDFGEWRERLRVAELDLLNLPAVERFAEYLRSTEPHVDLLINNAAQTLRRPPEYYEALRAAEAQLALAPGARELLLAPEGGAHAPVVNGAIGSGNGGSVGEPYALEFDGEPVDFRARNSWVLQACEIETAELLETHLVGAFAPFILNTRLRPLLERSPFAERFIVNVSAMEGQFARPSKTERHPHTNMAKAALNMLTRTSAADFACGGIYMNSVDTGWVTNENPGAIKREQRAAGFVPPLDVIDGAARIYAPIVEGVEGKPVWGKFLKDYAEYAW